MRATPEFKDWFSSKLADLRGLSQELLTVSDHPPMMLIVSNDDKLAILPMRMFFDAALGPHGKDVAAGLHRQVAAKDNIFAAILVCEAWTASSNVVGLTQQEINEMPNPSERSDREEIVLWNARRLDMQLFAVAKIDRTTEVTLSEVKIIDAEDPQTFMSIGGDEDEVRH